MVTHARCWWFITFTEKLETMFDFRKPDPAQIDDFIEVQAQLELTYSSIGATRSPAPPDGFQVDHNRICLGQGRAVYEQAKRALQDWQHFRLNWVSLHHPDALPEPGQTVAILAHALGLWVLNASMPSRMAHCPSMRSAAKNAFRWNGGPMMIRSGMICMLSHDRSSCYRKSLIPMCVANRNSLPAIRCRR